jgi:hypothetical protein
MPQHDHVGRGHDAYDKPDGCPSEEYGSGYPAYHASQRKGHYLCRSNQYRQMVRVEQQNDAGRPQGAPPPSGLLKLGNHGRDGDQQK